VRTAPFTLDAKVYGMTQSSVSVPFDELNLFASSPTIAGPFIYQRANVTDVFSAGTTVPGLENVPLVTPEPGPDGLTLFGAMSGNLVVAKRNGAGAFTTPEIVVRPASEGFLGSPAISGDCRSLYFVQTKSTAVGDAISVVTR
jgi:hypothetical protein